MLLSERGRRLASALGVALLVAPLCVGWAHVDACPPVSTSTEERTGRAFDEEGTRTDRTAHPHDASEGRSSVGLQVLARAPWIERSEWRAAQAYASRPPAAFSPRHRAPSRAPRRSTPRPDDDDDER